MTSNDMHDVQTSKQGTTMTAEAVKDVGKHNEIRVCTGTDSGLRLDLGVHGVQQPHSGQVEHCLA